MNWRIVRYSILATILIPGTSVWACSFCPGNLVTRPALIEHFHRSDYVAIGRLSNPRYDPQKGRGVTDFSVTRVIKCESRQSISQAFILPQYIPVIGNTPRDYIVFGRYDVNDRLDIIHGASTNHEFSDYFQKLIKISHNDRAALLKFAFEHLDAIDDLISKEAFQILSRTSDEDIARHRTSFDGKKLFSLIQDPSTPKERLGVYFLMLGHCGDTSHVPKLVKLTSFGPQSDSRPEHLGAIVAAIVLLAPEQGWRLLEDKLQEKDAEYSQQLQLLSTIRYLQTTQGMSARPRLIQCIKGALRTSEIAHLFVEDLRQWRWGELTDDILSLYDKSAQHWPLLKRAVIRYALTESKPKTIGFIKQIKQTEPELLEAIIKSLK